MTEDPAWLHDPIHLERQRVLYAGLRETLDAQAVWCAMAYERVAQLERELERRKTAERGRFEVNDEPEGT